MGKGTAGWLRDLPIRYKLLLTYSAVFMVVIMLGGGVVYTSVRHTLEGNIVSELRNSTTSILNLVSSSMTGAIRNYLRATTDKNLETVRHFYDKSQAGEMSEDEAKRLAGGVILSQKIGHTGYVCSLDSQGIVRVHPKSQLVGKNLSEYAFVRELKHRREGYLEYDWKNPEDDAPRPKAMYMTYFEPWDWIVIASSYREEFTQLVKIEDFRESVLSLKFGASGYAFVADTKGNLIIHPNLQGENLLERDESTSGFFTTMVETKRGQLHYPWRDPGQLFERQKMVIYDYIPEYDWIVASTSYLEEVYAPLERVRNLFFLVAVGLLIFLLPFTFLVSSFITKPVKGLMERFEQGARGDFTVRMVSRWDDEVGQLATYFNTFMQRFGGYSDSLRAEIAERKLAEEALRLSEERYRSVMEAAPDPIAVYDMSGKVLYFNPAFEEVFGWGIEECQGKTMDHFVPEDCWPETLRGIKLLQRGKKLSGVRTDRLTRGGEKRHVSISGSPYMGGDGEWAGSMMILRDITERVRAERGLRLSEEMFSKAFQSSPNGITITTANDLKFLNVNESFLAITGHDRDEVTGHTPAEIQLFSAPEIGRKILREIKHKGKLRGYEAEFLTKSGETRLGSFSVDRIEIWDEPCMLTQLEDITEAKRLEREVLESGERERRRLGHELHDDLGPHLIGIEVLGKVLAKKLGDKDLSEADYAEKIRDLTGEAIEKTRALTRGLGTVHLTADGLELALRELAAHTEEIFSISCRCRVEGDTGLADDSVATQFFYIAREAVHNAVKHAKADEIVISLSRVGDDFTLEVSDDGIGIPEKPKGQGMGLRIMGFRAGIIAATLEVGPGLDTGTRVTVSRPTDEKTETIEPGAERVTDRESV
jgi:PAS domain S-box-containing protein